MFWLPCQICPKTIQKSKVNFKRSRMSLSKCQRAASRIASSLTTTETFIVRYWDTSTRCSSRSGTTPSHRNSHCPCSHFKSYADHIKPVPVGSTSSHTMLLQSSRELVFPIFLADFSQLATAPSTSWHRGLLSLPSRSLVAAS